MFNSDVESTSFCFYKKLWSFSYFKLQKYQSLCPFFQSLKHIPSSFLQGNFEEANASLL